MKTQKNNVKLCNIDENGWEYHQLELLAKADGHASLKSAANDGGLWGLTFEELMALWTVPKVSEKKKPKFKVGDMVQSSPDSCDVLRMEMTWRAQIIEVKPSKHAPDGVCYETLGYWSNESLKKRPTLRQLWSRSLVLMT